MAKNRSLNKIGKEFDELVADMKKTATEWAKASGAKKQTLLMKMKQMTKEKKELQAEMERAVMDIDKDATLQVDERYVKIAMRGAIGRLVEKQLKAAIPNRSARRLMERKRAQFYEYLEHASLMMVQELRNVLPVNEWNAVRQLIAPIAGLNEAGMSDDQMAQVIADMTKELSKGEFQIEPDAIEISDNPSDIGDILDIESDAKIKMEHAFNNASRTHKRVLNEALGLTLLLSIPTLVKLLGNIVDFIGSLFKKQKPGEAAARRVINRMAVVTKADKAIPSKEELKTKLGGAMKGIASGISFESDAEYIDLAYEMVAKDVEHHFKAELDKKRKDPMSPSAALTQSDDQAAKTLGIHKAKFEVDGSKSIPLDPDNLKHTLHVMHTASKATSVGKFIGEWAHKFHELYVAPIRVVIATAVALFTGWKDAAKETESKKGFFGKIKQAGSYLMNRWKNFKAIWSDSYKKSEALADGIYTAVMIIVTIWMGMTTMEHLAEIKTPAGNLAQLITDNWKIFTEAGTKISKLTDLSVGAFQSILQVVLASKGVL